MPADPNFDYEASLIACAQGDRAALQGLYRQESSRMLGVALRIVRRRQLAEDIVHDTFLNIWTKAGSFDASRGSGRGWVYSLVRHQALNAIRNTGREVGTDDEELEEQAVQASRSAMEAFAQPGSLGRLDTCLGRLDEVKRDCIVYAYVEGCSHGEIASRLNAPLGTVKAWIRRGMEALRECMG